MKILRSKSSFFSKAFNTSVLEKNRWPWIDYLRGVAIILVVYRHALLGIQFSGITVPATLVNANMIFYSFRMPLFFILSGAFISRSIAKRNFGKIFGIKFENLFYPYLVWTFLQITFQILFSGFTNAHRTIEDYTYIFYQPRNLDQFWYLPALFNTTIIYVLVKIKIKPSIWAQLLIGIILYYLSSYVNQISMLSDWMEFYFFYALGDALSNVFFKESTQKKLKNPVLLLGAIPIFILAQLFYLSNNESYYLHSILGKTEFIVIALIGCFSMLLLAFRLQVWNTFRFLRVLGFHSLYIYVMHVFVAALVRMIMTKFLHIYNAEILLLCGISFGAIVPVIFYNLLVKDNILWFLFSYRRNDSNSKLKEVSQTETTILKPSPLTPYGKKVVE